ncbi:MAG TPA: hypothetical protein VGL11_03395 [Candidatus Binatia bacterium]
MAYRGQSNWPPVWMWVGGERNQNPKGEIGILHEVTLPPAGAPNRCSLIVEHEGAVYLGSLLFDDPSFCGDLVQLLRNHCGHSVEQIGSLDLSHLL